MAKAPPRRTETLLSRTFDRTDIERRETLTGLSGSLSAVVRPADLLTILAEVFANALRHGEVTRLGVTARRRGPVLLLAFAHEPPLSGAACAALVRAKSGWLPTIDEPAPGGRGLPLLCRLTRRQTLSVDRSCLRIWLAAMNTGDRAWRPVATLL
jgi:hypothetical protein